MDYDIFNGDADGLCALVQLRLAEPRDATLVTGVKRDIQLLGRVPAAAGDRLTVLDISLDSNRDALREALAQGAVVRWFDHHFAGEVPIHPDLQADIDPAADVCTSLLVDRAMGGRFRTWAVAAAFGDNLREAAARAAVEAGLPAEKTARLRELGEVLNYNAYGDTLADLLVPPADLFRALLASGDPFAFIDGSPIFKDLRAGYRQDMARCEGVAPVRETAAGAVFVLPDAPWARRVSGVMANDVASCHRSRAHAILTAKTDGGYLVSVRAPKDRPSGADTLCRGFPSGGGRRAAAGINHLPEEALEEFLRRFAATRWGAPQA
jgi:hypothetical protein